MAYSSSTSSVHKKSYLYDVFLSFSGEDTRRTFVDHLYYALHQQGIRTFKDDQRLEKGKRINDELLQSIEDSRLYIIVFSKNYASSSWCLNELLKIMECQKKKEQIAYPVFYDVEPMEIRKQSGSVGEALSKHKNGSEVQIWREALTKAANLSGWDLRNIADGHEAQVIRLIVEEVSHDLCSFTYVNTDEKLVGIKQRMQDLELFLNTGLDDVRMIGIKGMGGAGKTTLARAIFDKLSIQFEARTFVENVREVSKASLSGLNSMQKQILIDVLKDQWITVSSVHDGINMMKMRLSGKKVLVVLDDVDQLSQLEALAGDSSWFKPGSRIIITTRDEQVLLSHRVSLIHHVDLLSDEEAMHLFCRYAFGKDVPVREYEKESLEVVRYAAGLPLTVKVLGSSLCGKDKPEWIDTLARLKTIPLEETIRKLGLSYESLEDEHKKIFLDVACLLKNWKMEDAIRMLDGCGFHARNGLRVLQRKSLITIEEVSATPFDFYLSDESQRSEQICIHDHIEEMGKNIVRSLHPDDPSRHSRLWVQEEIEHVFACHIGAEETRCIRIELTPDIDLAGLIHMKKLRCLIVNYDSVASNYFEFVRNGHSVGDGHKVCEYLPNALRYLYWRCYPNRCLPKISGTNNLVTVEIYNSRIEQLWEGGMDMKKLKYLVLHNTHHLKTCDLGVFPNLERLYLKGCKKLVELRIPTAGCLKRLVYLTIYSCKRIRSLSFVKHLESLEFLRLSRLNPKEFPDIIPTDANSSLQHLYIRKSDIVELPSSIKKLCKLVYLNLEHCKNLKSLPISFCSLQHLKVLRLVFCGIEELPEDFGQLEYLEELYLAFCTSLKHLPDSICKLKHLKTLALHVCSALERLPEDLDKLESLEVLNFLRTYRIRDIPGSICKLKHLKTLALRFCSALEKLPDDLDKLESLELLDLTQCHRIRDIPRSICKLKHLKILALHHCSALQKLPKGIGKLESLEVLDLSWCESIEDIPSSICKLKRLKKLDLMFCMKLRKLPGEVGDLENLRELNIECTSISQLPRSISLLKGLKLKL
uniref:disease resistance protein RPV1-like n=1 Tax=Erigeron canadensis TaxID=72917 RepID=UPI001CB9990A|nr:disease resistance protein RPV1-like [Erigeron canadensis]XP_043626387.1 disease resistance protein RPV1-like [Erigeron canadensis]